MTVRKVRGERQSMIEGTTDGKYRKRRPNTEIDPGMGDELVYANRESLDPLMNYAYPNVEYPNKVVPG